MGLVSRRQPLAILINGIIVDTGAVDRIDRIDEDWRFFNRDKERDERQQLTKLEKRRDGKQRKTSWKKLEQEGESWSKIPFFIYHIFFFFFRAVTGASDALGVK